MKKTLLTCLFALSLTSCTHSLITGSYYFTLGTQCLERGEYEEARNFLEKSIEHDPSQPRSHTNLAIAYDNLGEDKKAWLEFRNAYKLEPRDKYIAINLVNFWNKTKVIAEFQKDTSQSQITDLLGEPDSIIRTGLRTTSFIYGNIEIYFRDGKYVAERIN